MHTGVQVTLYFCAFHVRTYSWLECNNTILLRGYCSRVIWVQVSKYSQLYYLFLRRVLTVQCNHDIQGIQGVQGNHDIQGIQVVQGLQGVQCNNVTGSGQYYWPDPIENSFKQFVKYLDQWRNCVTSSGLKLQGSMLTHILFCRRGGV